MKRPAYSNVLRDVIRRKPGFTIVELLIVVVVIAILAAITIVAYNGVSQRAKAAAASTAAEQAAKKIMTYAVTNAESYPVDLATAGVTDTDSTKYQYSVDNTTSPRTFCVTATVSSVSYYIQSSKVTSSAGGCPGHGANGIAAVTNLATNPSFEATSGTVEVRRNYFTTTNNLAMSSTIVSSSTYRGFSMSVTPGDVYSFRRIPPLTNRFRVTFTSELPANGVSYFGGTGQTADYDGQEVINGITVPANATHMFLYLSNANESIPGVLVEKMPTAGPYFNGSVSPDEDMTPSWIGASGASQSILTARTMTTVYPGTGVIAIQSQKWSCDGDYSLRLIAKSTGAISGSYVRISVGPDSAERGTFLLTMYREGVQPNTSSNDGRAYWNPVPQPGSEVWRAAGTNTVRVFGEASSSGEIVVAHGGRAGDPDLYVDCFARMKGNYAGPFRSGASPNWVWNGAPNASTSTGPSI